MGNEQIGRGYIEWGYEAYVNGCAVHQRTPELVKKPNIDDLQEKNPLVWRTKDLKKHIRQWILIKQATGCNMALVLPGYIPDWYALSNFLSMKFDLWYATEFCKVFDMPVGLARSQRGRLAVVEGIYNVRFYSTDQEQQELETLYPPQPLEESEEDEEEEIAHNPNAFRFKRNLEHYSGYSSGRGGNSNVRGLASALFGGIFFSHTH